MNAKCWLVAFLVAACGEAMPPNTATQVTVREVRYPDAPNGLSGLARDENGQLWAVAERGSLVRFNSKNQRFSNVPLHGVADGLELESLTFLANGDVAIGTETEVEFRESDLILFARRETSGALKVYGHMVVAYRMWGISPMASQGIEGICATRENLVVSGEPTMNENGNRYAPLAIYSFESASWVAIRIELTTDSGKISGIACRQVGAAVHFIAIERHFGIAHILQGRVKDPVFGDIVVPDVVLDLSGRRDNLEGITWLDDGSVALVTDNFFRGERSGASKLFFSTLLRPQKGVRNTPVLGTY